MEDPNQEKKSRFDLQPHYIEWGLTALGVIVACVLVVFVLLILLAFGAAVFAYTQGYGFPTQESVAKELLANPSGSNALFSKDVEDVDSLTGPIVTDSSAEVLGVDKSMSNSTVYVKATTDQGGEVQYKISMVRDLIGWKISNVELYFPSQN